MLQRFKKEEFDDILNNKNPLIWDCVIGSILIGIDRGFQSVSCFEVESPTIITTFKMARCEWPATLQNALEFYISKEEYEICGLIKEYQQKLNKI